jgi:hypothetical protein
MTPTLLVVDVVEGCAEQVSAAVRGYVGILGVSLFAILLFCFPKTTSNKGSPLHYYTVVDDYDHTVSCGLFN